MGRKKKKASKPWCWYCNREFDDEKILLQHQKAKHFKCHICHKKLFTGPGLQIHCMQVHKENIDRVPNAIKGRDNITLEICGMDNIPEEDLIEHEKLKGSGVIFERDDDRDLDEAIGGQPPTKKQYQLPPGTIHGPLPHMPPVLPSQQQSGTLPLMSMMPPLPPAPPPSTSAAMMMPPNLMQQPSPHHFSMLHQQVPPLPPMLPQQQQHMNLPKPLFPSAAHLDQEKLNQYDINSSSSYILDQQQQASTAYNSNKNKIENVSGTKIIHPDEDISLEEFRASHHKYKYIPSQASSSSSVAASYGRAPILTTHQVNSAYQMPNYYGMNQPMPLSIPPPQHQYQQQTQQQAQQNLIPTGPPQLMSLTTNGPVLNRF